MTILSTETYFERFTALGLFAHADETTIAEAKGRLADFVPTVPVDPLKILASVPNTILLRDAYHAIDNTTQVARLAAMVHSQHKSLADFAASYTANLDDTEPSRLHEHVQAFNTFLADTEADERFYSLHYPDDQGLYGPDMMWGLLCLPYEVRYDPRLTALLKFSPETHEWESQRTRDIIKILRDIHLLPSDISDDVIIEKGNAGYAKTANAVRILNTVTLELYAFDAERIYDPVKDYQELVSYFILWSKAQFEPPYWAVWYLPEDEWRSQWDVKFAFRFAEKDYEFAIYYESDWVKMDFVKLINQALSDAGIDGQFYHRKSGDQVANFLFLRQSQIDTLLAHGLIDLYTL